MPLNFFSENAKVEHDYFGVKTDKDIVPQSHLTIQAFIWWGKSLCPPPNVWKILVTLNLVTWYYCKILYFVTFRGTS